MALRCCCTALAQLRPVTPCGTCALVNNTSWSSPPSVKPHVQAKPLQGLLACEAVALCSISHVHQLRQTQSGRASHIVPHPFCHRAR